MVRNIIFFLALMLCGSQALAGQADPADTFKVAKLDENLFRQERPKVSLKVDEEYEFYDISGASSGEWRQQMRTGGTKWDDGKKYAALTTWDIRYRYETTSKNGRYSIKSVTTNVGIVYRFPRWLATPSTSKEQLAEMWHTYMDHLKTHEFGHKDLAVKTAAEINETLASLNSFSSSRELDKEAHRLAEKKLKRLKEAQVEYDAETHHGETQGAVLP